mgnify:FL=1
MVMLFMPFVRAEAGRMWGTESHRKKSVVKALRFAKFRGYGSRELDKFKPSDIHAFFDLLSQQGLTANTVRHYGAMLSVVFKHAVREELISHSPRFTWTPIEGGKRPLYFTQQQLDSMESYFDDKHQQWWLRHFIVIGHQTGMRLGEILKITPDIMSLDNKGGHWVHLATTKNGSERWVPLNHRSLAAIRALDCRATKYWSHASFYTAWATMRRDLLGGDIRYVFHTLRHTAATVMANDLGANTAVIGLLLGHRSEATTRKYIKAKPDALQALVQQMAG